jgi:hypothetical protein
MVLTEGWQHQCRKTNAQRPVRANPRDDLLAEEGHRAAVFVAGRAPDQELLAPPAQEKHTTLHPIPCRWQPVAIRIPAERKVAVANWPTAAIYWNIRAPSTRVVLQKAERQGRYQRLAQLKPKIAVHSGKDSAI